jgi:hypothetical protein
MGRRNHHKAAIVSDVPEIAVYPYSVSESRIILKVYMPPVRGLANWGLEITR